MTFLDSLLPGARFRTESGRVGTLLRVGAMSCGVRWDARTVEQAGDEGPLFEASRDVDVAPQTEVVQIADPPTEATP